MATRLGIGLGGASVDTLRREAVLADQAGFDFVSVGDNPGHQLESLVALTVAAHVTSRCRIGTTMVDPRGRDPLVLAAGLSSIEQIAPGRVFLGVATGRARGRGSLRHLAAYLTALRELWTDGHTRYDGATLELDWPARAVPILVGASGPGALRLAGALGDGVVIETGVLEAQVASALGALAEGASGAGRCIDDLERWWYLKASLAPTIGEAVDHARNGLASTAALTLGRDPVAAGVPADLRRRCREAFERYDMKAHVGGDAANPNRALVEDTDLLAYLLDRYGLVGNSDDWVARLEVLASRGVDRVFCAAIVPDRAALIEAAGTSVIRRLG